MLAQAIICPALLMVWHLGDIVAMLITGKPPLPAFYGGQVWIPAAHWAVPAPRGLPFPAPRWGSGPSNRLVGCFFSSWLHGAQLPFIRHPSRPGECSGLLSINLNKLVHATGLGGFCAWEDRAKEVLKAGFFHPC